MPKPIATSTMPRAATAVTVVNAISIHPRFPALDLRNIVRPPRTRCSGWWPELGMAERNLVLAIREPKEQAIMHCSLTDASLRFGKPPDVPSAIVTFRRRPM
jgi:hypothetical protein